MEIFKKHSECYWDFLVDVMNDIFPMWETVSKKDEISPKELIKHLNDGKRGEFIHKYACDTFLIYYEISREYFNIKCGEIVPAGLKPRFDFCFLLNAMFLYTVKDYITCSEELFRIKNLPESVVKKLKEGVYNNYTKEYREYWNNEKIEYLK